jgi:CBS domain containing-hemolysin-like protein
VPVYDKTRDDIVGILYSKDLLPELAKCEEEPRKPLPELLRKPLFVPET